MRAAVRVSWRLGLLGLGVACSQPSATFPCYADEMCADGPLRGFCEDVGYCSFPDLDCPSNRRFGDRSPAGLAGECVEAGDPTGTTSTTTDALPSTGADDIADGSSDGGSSDASTGGIPGCANPFADDFEDGVLDPRWEAFWDDGITVDEADGRLRLTIDAGPSDRYGGIYSDMRDLRGVVVEAELAPVGDQVHAGLEYWLSIGVEGCSHEIGISGDVISGWSRGDAFYDEPIDPFEPLRVRFRV
ncbi:MAG: hypothetical protein KDK70_21540, partial [Myxococcales bacterium]|nr:hypothetical protein [Myxococcales bacterium]